MGLVEYLGVAAAVLVNLGVFWRAFRGIWGPAKKTLEKYQTALEESKAQIDDLMKINAEQDRLLSEIMESQKALKSGLQIILRFRLKRECERIVFRKRISVKEREDLFSIHTAYEALGENGLVTSIYTEAINQPTVYPDGKDKE